MFALNVPNPTHWQAILPEITEQVSLACGPVVGDTITLHSFTLAYDDEYEDITSLTVRTMFYRFADYLMWQRVATLDVA